MVSVAKQAFLAPHPGDTDVVLSNAYPIDISLTFMRSKGMIPLLRARPGASRVVIASCSQGIGHHALFPFVDVPRFHRQRLLVRKALASPRQAPGMAARVLARAAARRIHPRGRSILPSEGESRAARPAWLFGARTPLRSHLPGIRRADSWDQVLRVVRREQDSKERLRVAVYTCAPLQILPLGGEEIEYGSGIAE
jgi:hypothetical protein